MLEALACIIAGTLSLFGLGSIFVGICVQFAEHIIWPMVEFILHLFGIM